MVALEFEGIRLFAKLEFCNHFGSVKDRSAYWILKSAIEAGDIGNESTIIESSSGNFANALACYCHLLGLRFIPVIDPNITRGNESYLRELCQRVEKVEQRDDMGGFLKTRLQRVKELMAQEPGAYWTNQYGNEWAVEAHYRLTGEELCQSVSQLDYIFIGVSTGGTIAGISQRLKDRFPSVQVIAVDVEGSVIFGGQPRRRYIPGIGSSISPGLLRQARIDDVVMVSEQETVLACKELLVRHGVFAGGSSGSAYAAVKAYVPKMHKLSVPPTVAFLCADSGKSYLETVFNPDWCKSRIGT